MPAALQSRRPIRDEGAVALGRRRRSSEIAFLLLLFHRAGAIVVDHAALAFGGRGTAHFGDDVGAGVAALLSTAPVSG